MSGRTITNGEILACVIGLLMGASAVGIAYDEVIVPERLADMHDKCERLSENYAINCGHGYRDAHGQFHWTKEPTP